MTIPFLVQHHSVYFSLLVCCMFVTPFSDSEKPVSHHLQCIYLFAPLPFTCPVLWHASLRSAGDILASPAVLGPPLDPGKGGQRQKAASQTRHPPSVRRASWKPQNYSLTSNMYFLSFYLYSHATYSFLSGGKE